VKKYEILETGRIRALVDIETLGVKVGDIGGFVETEYNLSHEGNCWISDNARVVGHSRVMRDALVHENAEILGESCITDYALIGGDVVIYGATIDGHAEIC